MNRKVFSQQRRTKLIDITKWRTISDKSSSSVSTDTEINASLAHTCLYAAMRVSNHSAFKQMYN